ncbi:MAG: hypothetical protein M1814_006095 [Vezdaea aestivalis]|nr:MAG: hypothetical protein M1814_006095 [Vezdaea aestivalis]
MSSGSLRELGKALSTALAQPNITVPLPQDLSHTIDQYLEKHVAVEEEDAKKLQEDLLILYKRHVAEDSTKHASFLAVLRKLRPNLRGSERLTEWWKILVRPTIEVLGKDKAVVLETRGILLDILTYDEDEKDKETNLQLSRVFLKRILELYLEKTKPCSRVEDFFSREDEGAKFIAEQIESLIVAFGRKRPRDLFFAVDEIVLKKDQRTQALGLLSTFLRHQPPHLYEVLQTNLIESLLRCLLLDTSTTALSLALTNLVMFLPHIPSSLVSFLPCLFVIYGRISCWERYSLSPIDADKGDTKAGSTLPNGGIPVDPTWEVLEYSFETADSTTPELSHFFTFLYGLYPINFTIFIRNPATYLEDAQYEGSQTVDFNSDLIKQRTEKHRRLHLLHPNFFNISAETELTDVNRWVDSDPADIVADCMALCASDSSRVDDPGPPPTTRLPELPAAYLPTEDIPPQSLLAMDDDGTTLANEDGSPTNSRFGDAWINQDSGKLNGLSRSSSKRKLSHRKRNTTRSNGTRSGHQSPAARAADAGDSPTLPALPYAKPDVELQDMLQAQEKLRGSMHSNFGNESTTSLQGKETDSPRVDVYLNSLIEPKLARSPAIRPTSSDSHGAIAFLQREVVLLKNDLNFERYLKQQHLSHIGQLQRKYIKEATVEAETQNLINKTHALSLKLDEAKRSYAMLKRETSTSKNQSKKWESELNAKIRTLREEQKQWRTDEGSVRRELYTAKKEYEQLQKYVVEIERKELLSQQNLQAIEVDLSEMERLRTEVDRLQIRLRDLQSREKDFELATSNEELARTELEMANLKLKSRDSDRDRLRKAYDNRIEDLENQLEALQSSKPGQATANHQAMLDSALSSAHSRFTHLKKTHTELYRRYRALDMQYMDLKAETENNNHGVKGSQSGSNPSSHQNDSQKFLHDEFDVMTASSEENLDPEAFDSFDIDGIAASPLATGSFGNRRTSQYPASMTSGSLGTSPNMQRGLDSTGSLRSAGSSGKIIRGPMVIGPVGPKIKADSEVRVYGRGGVQNIKMKDKKDKDKESRPSSTLKTIRGLI